MGLSSRLVAAAGGRLRGDGREPLLRPAAAGHDRPRAGRLLRHRRPARDRDPGRLRRRAAADRPARRPAAAPHGSSRGCWCSTPLALAGADRRAVVRRARGGAGASSACRACAAQILVPFASLAGRRGRARARRRAGDERAAARASCSRARSAGLVAELGGWRLIYGLAAGAMLILAVVLRRALPAVEPPERHGLSTAAAAARSARWSARSRRCAMRMAFGFLSMASLQRVLDVDRVPALRAGVRLQRGGHRPVLARRARRARGSRRSRAAPPTAGTSAGRARGSPRVGGARRAGACSRSARRSLAALMAGIVVLDLGVQADADPQPERDLPAAPGGAQPAQHGLHDVLLRRRGDRLGGRLARVGARRLGRGERGAARSPPRSASLLSLRRS